MVDNFTVMIEYDDVIYETDRAFLLKIDNEQVWVPNSVAIDPPRVKSGPGAVEVAEWFAHKEELI
jgi:hypothetical protein